MASSLRVVPLAVRFPVPLPVRMPVRMLVALPVTLLVARRGEARCL